MLDMRWKALDRAMNSSYFLAQGDAAFQASFAALSLGSERQGNLLNDVISLNRRRWL